MVEETRENHRPDASHWQILSHDIVHASNKKIQLSVLV